MADYRSGQRAEVRGKLTPPEFVEVEIMVISAPHYPALLNQQVNPPRQRGTWHSDDAGDAGFGEGLTLQVPNENHPSHQHQLARMR
jgi:hypothetical protein